MRERLFVLPILIILGLIVLILILFIVRINSNTTETSPLSFPTPTIFVAATPTPFPNKPFIDTPVYPTLSSDTTPDTASRGEIIRLMPISTRTYDIEYLTTSDMFIVTIKESPYLANQKLAEEWFRERGIYDLPSFNVKFTKYPFVE